MKTLQIIGGSLLGVGILILVLVLTFSGNSKKNNEEKSPEPQTENYTSVYRTSGTEFATTTKPIKAHLNPLKTTLYVIGEGYAKAILESDPEKFFIFKEKPESTSSNMQKWWSMPDGDYLVYSEGVQEIEFHWEQ